ncbi:type I-E CRISPR-associated protein Cas6/Cse3/CasE [Lactobacillus agrestimuris]|uniref:type I-E CRISPR-associated protein Cas6/Cse3/CasE n=1 Tax=Lactobacillus agrestimuris TaxID=2941328 RepID=UPI0020445410|nr:type I-E CRISPR-associated protein Cas6/Cse3/CasE [Lactobacillus agrestimuris]
MYLSRVEIDFSDRLKVKDLNQLGGYHNWVEKSFPEDLKDPNRPRHLWRIDHLNNKTYLLVLSEKKPDIEKLEKYGVAGTAGTKSYDKFLADLKNGMFMRFRLTANPTRKVTKPGERQGRVFPHITVKQQKNWLINRMDMNGFTIPQVDQEYQFDVVNREWPILKHKHAHMAKLSRITFEGILQITDLEKFKEMLVKGIGREKAYGMGLMTVIPMESENE